MIAALLVEEASYDWVERRNLKEQICNPFHNCLGNLTREESGEWRYGNIIRHNGLNMNLFALYGNLLLDEANHLIRVHKLISNLFEFLRSESLIQ